MAFHPAQLKGTGVALVTPFKNDKSIDFNALGKIVNHCIDNGVNFLVVLGTTGESPVLSATEKEQVFKAVVDFNKGRVPLVAGMGGNATATVIEEMRHFPFREEYAAFLSVTPYYNKPSQEGLLQHYSALASMSPLPILLYNVPGRTGISMQAATTLKLAHQHKNIIGIKEASGSMQACYDLVSGKPENFLVLSGDDDLVFPQIACGMDGVISVAAQCFTADFCNMVQYSLSGDVKTAKALHYQLINGIQLLFKEGNPAGVKAALQQLGLCENELRLPLIPASTALYNAIKDFTSKQK
jgi:4-hydroxy-tetrahydrodipicolinate synthase